MGIGMEILIGLALGIFMEAGLVSVGLTMWLITSFVPMYKYLDYQFKEAYGSEY